VEEAVNIEEVDPELHRLLCWKIEQRQEINETFEVDSISVGEKDLLVKADGRLRRFTKVKEFKNFRKYRESIVKAEKEREEAIQEALKTRTPMSPETAMLLGMAMQNVIRRPK
jgi:hypothetical protein